ncbi:hypothetical protein [Mobilicoccus caccae]|uniref:Primosomal protein N' 3' DNA-binding domain-containing protein n=1 Tax=Mobilicoccus caccae TaxID=1859295 RepID=A0ABQ6IPQ5_9MICO|nr:hypothetical protein GCM10025883_19380 [Mobilicoccus caccae]
MASDAGAQQALVAVPATPERSGHAQGAAEAPTPESPVALVAVQVPLPHLDRGFEYRVPAEFDDGAVPGARVKVRFAGREVDGVVLERRARPEHAGRLADLRRVVSPEPVLTPEIATLARTVADRHAGTFADVLRLAVPPRHAQAEKALTARPPQAPVDPQVPAGDAAPSVGDPPGPVVDPPGPGVPAHRPTRRSSPRRRRARGVAIPLGRAFCGASPRVRGRGRRGRRCRRPIPTSTGPRRWPRPRRRRSQAVEEWCWSCRITATSPAWTRPCSPCSARDATCV